MNISETAFVAKAWNKNCKQIESNKFTLRWFTPTTEVELCGHATLATSTVIFANNSENGQQIEFETKFKSTLKAINNSNEKTITLDFPVNECQPIDRTINEWIEQIIEHTLGHKLSPDLIEDIQYSAGTKKLLLRLQERPESEKIIYSIEPNFNQLLKVNSNGLVRGVIVTQKTQRIHFLSRYFTPWNGINEDPVTGSTHTVLAPYWKIIYEKNGNHVDQLIGQQCSKRGGTVYCKIIGDRVQLSGKSRVVFSGSITI